MISMKKLSPSKLFRGFVGMKSYDPVMHGDYFIIFSKFPIKQPGFNGMSRPFFCGPEMCFFSCFRGDVKRRTVMMFE